MRNAFTRLTGLPSRLVAFSDDMDGLRKVPDNVPNKEMLATHLGKPVTAIPDPFGTHESFGHHNNARLRAFLDQFGFEYEFASSTDYYRSGRFDAALIRMAERHEQVRAVILPTLGPDRRATYSPFLPIHPRTGIVMQVPMEEVRPAEDLLVWVDPATGERFGTRITGGHCKAQWKADWALRWYALGVDYEMSGKDLIDSVKLSSQICRVLGGEPPIGFTYELFLDEEGTKISKSKGNGLSIEEWLHYAPPESLAQFMYNQPQRAKRLFFDVIPRAVDEYIASLERVNRLAEHLKKFEAGQNEEIIDDTTREIFHSTASVNLALAESRAWHIHNGIPNDPGSPISFTMLLNLASVINADNPEMLWGFLQRYAPGVTPETHPLVARLIERAVAYYRDRVVPEKKHRAATQAEAEAMRALAGMLRERVQELEAMPPDERAKAIQDLVYDAGRREPFLEPAKDGAKGDGRPGVSRAWFNALYQVLLGQPEGPRFGGFVALYGIAGTIGLIETALARDSAPA